MRFVLLSDTHNLHHRMIPPPAGDVIVHAGDLTGNGTIGEIAEFFHWFEALPHRHKVVIAGNHDFALEREAVAAEALVPPGVTYLRDAGVTIEGIKLWGTPWQPWFYDWAFNLQRGPEIASKWEMIPDDIHVLATHGPPQGVLDETSRKPPQSVGCEALLERIGALPQLKLHVFGHIHEGYGTLVRGGCRFVNASICDVRYSPVNPAVTVDL